MEDTQTAMSPAELAEFSAAKYNKFVGTCGIRVHKVRPDYAQAVVEVHEEIRNAFGNLHGGLIFTLADAVSGMVARTDGRKYVTQSAGFEYLDNVGEGKVYGTGKVVRRGKKVVVIQVEISAEDGKLLAVGTFNMMPVNREIIRLDGSTDNVSD